MIDAADLKRSELLSALPDDALDELAKHAVRHQWSSDEPIFDKGAQGDSLFIVLDGTVEIFVESATGKRTHLAAIGHGEVFGELALFDPAPRSASARADKETVAVEVGRDHLQAIITENPTAAMSMIGVMSRNLTDQKEQLTYFNNFLDQKVKERTAEVRETQLEVIRRLGVASEYRDEDTGTHIFRMSNYAAALARRIGFDDDSAETLLNAAPMHDVGKIGVPDRVLLKPGKLDEDEWEIMKAHTIMGANMLAGSRSKVIKLARKIALTHHERWDGRGYPQGLKHDEIPVEARLCCVADVFDALTSERPYKKAWTNDDALQEIVDSGGTHFDPDIVEEFIAIRPEIEQIQAESRKMLDSTPMHEIVEDAS